MKGELTLIQVEHLTKRYGNRIAVNDLSFSVEKGQIYGFLGPNGAGKSTSMNVMTGYLSADSGSVVINGYDIEREPIKAKKSIGYLPEIPPLYQDMTVREYLIFVTELKKIPKKERKNAIANILEELNLSDVSERLIKNLSKGYRQRVGMAQALIGNPEVIILDEPMVGLDPKQIIEMRDMIKELGKEHTVLLSSHILSEIDAICDHIIILSDGKLAASGSPKELQDMMQTKTEIELTVIGEENVVLSIIQSMDEIEECKIVKSGSNQEKCPNLDECSNQEKLSNQNEEKENTVKLSVLSKEGKDIRKELSVKLASSGIVILEMQKKDTSLEDIFLQLTSKADESFDSSIEETEEIPEKEVNTDESNL